MNSVPIGMWQSFSPEPIMQRFMLVVYETICPLRPTIAGAVFYSTYMVPISVSLLP